MNSRAGARRESPGIARFLPWILLSFVLAAGAAETQRLPVRAYTTADGLAHDGVNCITRDSRGFLWFCTDDGVSRFDGRRFTNYRMPAEIAASRVNALVEDDGGFWLTTTGGAGVLFFEPSGPGAAAGVPRFTPYPGVPRGFADFAHQDSRGQVWIGSLYGLFKVDKEGRRVVPVPLEKQRVNGSPAGKIAVGPLVTGEDGSLWLGSNFGLVRRLGDGRLFHYPVLGRDDEYVVSLSIDHEGRVWAGSAAGLIVLYPEPIEGLDAVGERRGRPGPCAIEEQLPAVSPRIEVPREPGRMCLITSAHGLEHNDVRGLHRDSRRRLWIGTYRGGLARLEGGRLQTFTDRQLSDSFIDVMAEDELGNQWLGTRSKGALRIARHGLLSYGESDGLGTPQVLRIFETTSGELVVLSSGWTLNRFDGERFHAGRPRLPEEIVSTSRGRWWILQDRTGEWWVATGRGLYRYGAGSAAELPELEPAAVYRAGSGLAHDNVNRLFEDPAGDIWITSYFEPVKLVRWRRSTDSFEHYGAGEGLPSDNWPNVLSADRAGNVWFGMHNAGLARHRGDRFDVFGQDRGAPGGIVQGLFADRRGALWIASAEDLPGHVERPDQPRPVIRPHRFPGRIHPNQFCFVEDGEDFYVGTMNGLFRWHRTTGGLRRYSTADGLASNEVRVAARDSRGDLWFGTPNGVSRLVAGSEAPSKAPDVFIHSLRVAGEERPVHELGEKRLGPLVLEPHQNRIEVGFFGLDFEPVGGLLYQYRFTGSGEWSEASEQRAISATLAPGRYRFEVRSLREHGTVSARPATLSLHILPPLWRRPWFLTLAVLTGAAVLAWLHRLRVERLLDVERVRTRIATDLHDDIGAGLSRIAILSEVVKRQMVSVTGPEIDRDQEPNRLIDEIGGSARELVESMSDIVWSIDARKSRLGELAARMRSFAAQPMAERGIDWRLDVTGDGAGDVVLETEQRRHLLAILKETVNNALRHAEPQKVQVRLHVEAGRLSAEILDDGRGFDPRTAGGGRSGLGNIVQRAEALGGTAQVESTPGRGTRWHIEAPLRRRRRRLGSGNSSKGGKRSA